MLLYAIINLLKEHHQFFSDKMSKQYRHINLVYIFKYVDDILFSNRKLTKKNRRANDPPSYEKYYSPCKKTKKYVISFSLSLLSSPFLLYFLKMSKKKLIIMKKLRILPASVWKLFFVRARLRNKMKKKNTHDFFLDLNYDYFPIFHEERNDDKSPWKKIWIQNQPD